jgi:oxaloacetate decarboxylase (Na+ extruding) subunit alpha
MLSNLLTQLQEQDALGRLAEVLEEVPRVRADLGYPPLVTPTSQIVGIQAAMNVLTGGRYRQITQEVRDYVRGLYGTPPGRMDPELVHRVTEHTPAITGRPADLLAPELEAAVHDVRALVPAADTAEALSYALFPAVYKSYHSAREKGLSFEVLTSAGLGVVAALRGVPAPRPTTRPEPAPAAGISPWAFEGRTHQHAQRRWVVANHPRTRR